MMEMKTRVDGVGLIVERRDAVELTHTGLDNLFKWLEHVESKRLEGFRKENHDTFCVFSERLVCHRLLSRVWS